MPKLEINKIKNTVICADCMDILKELPDKSIDLVLTDPPYGIKMDKGFDGFGGFGGFGEPIARKRYENDDWDADRPSKEIFKEILRIGKLVLIFGGNYFADILPQSTHWLVWDKLNTMPTFSDCELIWTNSNRKSVMKYTFLWNGLIGKEQCRFHPTQKPLELLKMILLDYSKENDLVLDCFSGSGTTGVACKNLKRNFILIEKEPKYVEICRQRLRQGILL
jgi:DNA modification methylase